MDYKDKSNVIVKPNERVDDLHRKNYGIIQNPDKFCFGMDAVLLSGFTRVEKDESALDLGTGNGIIPILLEAKTQGRHFTGLEIQKDMVDMARRSLVMNKQEDKITIVAGDIKEASKLFPKASFDLVTSNPPYMKYNGGIINGSRSKAVARHEILCGLEDLIRESSLLLKQMGRFYIIHRPHRLVEIINLLSKYKLEAKKIRFVHPYLGKQANMVLIESVKGGGANLVVEPPLIVYKEPNVYTDEIYEIYNGD